MVFILFTKSLYIKYLGWFLPKYAYYWKVMSNNSVCYGEGYSPLQEPAAAAPSEGFQIT